MSLGVGYYNNNIDKKEILKYNILYFNRKEENQ